MDLLIRLVDGSVAHILLLNPGSRLLAPVSRLLSLKNISDVGSLKSHARSGYRRNRTHRNLSHPTIGGLRL